MAGELPVSLWYSEGEQYDYESAICSTNTGYFQNAGSCHDDYDGPCDVSHADNDPNNITYMVIPNLVFLMTMMMTMMMVAGMMIMLMMIMMIMMVAGNFCQVVWAGTSSLGIGCARSPKTGKVLNCYFCKVSQDWKGLKLDWKGLEFVKYPKAKGPEFSLFVNYPKTIGKV